MGEGIGCLLALLIFPALIIWAKITKNDRKTTIEARQRDQNYDLNRANITRTADYSWNSGLNDHYYRVIVDDTAKELVIFEGVLKKSEFEEYTKTIPYSEIIGFSILTDEQVSGGVGRAIVGGMLAGGVGAVVGAVTQKKQISSYKAIMYKNTISEPNYMFTFTGPRKTTDLDYVQAKDFAEKINSTVKAIIANNEQYAIQSVKNSNIVEEQIANKEIEPEGNLYLESEEVNEQLEIKTTSTIFCHNCGKKLYHTSKYCNYCGAKIELPIQDEIK